MSVVTTDFLERFMQDGATQVVDPWIEFLPGQLIAGPFMHPKPKS